MEENKCIVKSCENKTENLFCSPSDEELLKKWQEICKTDEKYFLVCENHFGSKDICLEKILEPSAVPAVDLIEQICEVNDESCGMCLEKISNNKFKVSKLSSDYFVQITGYKPLKEDICEGCYTFLQSYHKFKTDVKEQHKKLRFQNSDKSDEDCIVISQHKPKDQANSTIETNDELPVPKILHPKLPNEIVAKIKAVEDTNSQKALFRCKHCYFKSTEREPLISHIDANHYFPCAQCPFISSNKPLLTLHINKVHKGDRTTIICGICDKTFEEKSHINKHYEIAHNSQTSSYFMCFYCKTNCQSDKEFKYHYNKFHTTGKTTAEDQINNTKLQLALLIGKKEKISDQTKAKNYDDLMRRIGKSSVTVKKISKKKRKVKKDADDFDFQIPINTPIKIPNSLNPKSKPPITEVTIISSKGHKNQYLDEKIESDSGSDIEITAPISDDAISISSTDEDTYEVVGFSNEPTNKQVLEAKYKSLTFETNIKIKNVETLPANDMKNVFRCFSCNEYYDNVISLLEHREKSHPPEENSKNYEDIHKSKLAFKIERKKPVTADEGLSKVICDICLKYIKESNLEKHKELRHTEKKFLCHICSNTFADQTRFRYHIMKHEPETLFQCDMCERGYVTKGRLERHIRKFHLRIPHIRAICSICNKKLYKSENNANLLKKHMDKYHPNGKDEGYRVNEETNYYDCEKCGASYWDLYTFKKHSCEKGKLQLRCLDCMMPCGTAESLIKHRTTRCKKINPFLNSRGLKVLDIPQSPFSENAS